MAEGLTVIVSPLISLMKDQVDSLVQSSVEAAATLHSGLSPEERWEVEKRIRAGEIRMLYVAPERLRSLEFVLDPAQVGRRPLRGGRGALHLRMGPRLPPGLPLPAPRGAGPRQPAGPRAHGDRHATRAAGHPALAGDARARGRGDELQPAEPDLPGPLRKEKKAQAASGPGPDPKRPPPGIIYATTRKECEELRDEPAAHRGQRRPLPRRPRRRRRTDVQERFMTDEVDVVVATIAFGMGVDKPNVRFVIHASVPGSLPPTSRRPAAPDATESPASASSSTGAPTSGAASGLLPQTPPARTRSSLSSAGSQGGERGPGERPARARSALWAAWSRTWRGSCSGGSRRRISLARLRLVGRRRGAPGGRGAGGLRTRRSRGVVTSTRPCPARGDVSLPELARSAGVRPVVAQAALFRLMADGIVEAVPRGSLADIRLKTRASTRGAAVHRGPAQDPDAGGVRPDPDGRDLRHLSACRREHLLRHFGDTEEVAPCAGCDVCLGEIRRTRASP